MPSSRNSDDNNWYKAMDRSSNNNNNNNNNNNIKKRQGYEQKFQQTLKPSAKQHGTKQKDSNDNLHKTLSEMEVDFMFREPFILTGYRLPNQSWRYYFASIFWLHNETLNVWTHAIGSLCVLVRAMFLCSNFDSFLDPRSVAVIGFTLGCFLNNFLSTLAHLLHSKSPRYHYILYILDYAGITFYNLGNAVGSMYACSHPGNYAEMKDFFLPGAVFLSWLSFIGCTLARLRYKGHVEIQRKLIMVGVLGMTAAFIAYPMTGRYLDCMKEEGCSLASLNHITVVFVFFTLDALSYTAHCPERWFPGHFDIWGHGHQWFHVIVSVTQQLQLHALHVDLVQLSRGSHVVIDFPSILLAFVVLAIVEAVSLRCVISSIDKKVSQES